MIMPRLGLASFSKIAAVMREIRNEAATRSCHVSVLLRLCSFASNPHAHEMAQAKRGTPWSTQREQLTYNL